MGPKEVDGRKLGVSELAPFRGLGDADTTSVHS
jgi:hypothetical protein